MNNKKISFRQVWDKQKYFVQTNKTGNYMYRKLSTIFTYVFIKLDISPNSITLLTYLSCIVGYIFLSIGTHLFFVIGGLIFIITILMDSADGDVARIQDKKSIEGAYFDEIGHYIYSCCLGFGLGHGLYKLYNMEIFLILGLILSVVFAVEYAIVYALGSVVRQKILEKKIWNYIYKNRSWGTSNFFTKIFGIYPFQGLVYSYYFIVPITLTLFIIDYFLSGASAFPLTLFGFRFGFAPLYLFIVGGVKLIWILTLILKMNKWSYITRFLEKNI